MSTIMHAVSSIVTALLNGLQALAEAVTQGGEKDMEYVVLASVVAIIAFWLAVRYSSLAAHWWRGLLSSMSAGL